MAHLLLYGGRLQHTKTSWIKSTTRSNEDKRRVRQKAFSVTDCRFHPSPVLPTRSLLLLRKGKWHPILCALMLNRAALDVHWSPSGKRLHTRAPKKLLVVVANERGFKQSNTKRRVAGASTRHTPGFSWACLK